MVLAMAMMGLPGRTDESTSGARAGGHAVAVRLAPYVLAPGDRLSGIAEQFGIDYEQLRLSNLSLDPRAMKVGEVILLPLPETAAPPRRDLAREIRRGIRGFDRVALTFDAGADVGALDELLAVLRAREVVCTFFVTGRWCERHPHALQRVADAGHEVFSHSYTHRPFPELSDRAIVDELESTERIVAGTIGWSTRPYFRPPYGDRNQRVLEAAAGAGWQCVYWTLDSYDAVGRAKSPEQIIERVLLPPGTRDPRAFLDGAIVLFHAAKPSTARAAGRIVDGLRGYGLEPVPLTELLAPPAFFVPPRPAVPPPAAE
jgi:peptidoglycan/xylan/chitin deacetylase (PgdA/CDA1 family)